ARLRFNQVKFPQRLQRREPAHDNIGVVAGCAGELKAQIAERYSAALYRLNHDRLRQGHKDDIVHIQICVLGLRPGPSWKWPEDVITVQHHQVIAFGENDEARWRSKSAYNVRDRICMA